MILGTTMVFYRLLWACLLPVGLVYLWLRGRKDPLYRQHIGERFGVYSKPLPQRPVWIHAVSIGELRSATALIRCALAAGHNVLVTNFTPAGRRESEKQFAPEIASGRLAVVYVPFDMSWCHRRLIAACQPQICLPLEVEIWPCMIHATRRAGVPLYLCNAQYATKSWIRDAKGLKFRKRIVAKCAGAFVKSDIHKQRYESIGVEDVIVTGELRFDQAIPDYLLDAAEAHRPALQRDNRQVIAIASGVEHEETIYRDMIQNLVANAHERGSPAPLVIYVPRAPERFDAVFDGLCQAGLSVERRSRLGAPGAEGLKNIQLPDTNKIQVLLGDSLGEMFYYLALAQKVIVGGGFYERGAHNIIEPLAIGKPAYVGPYTWTIEYPFEEAKLAGIATSYETPDAMVDALLALPVPEPQTIAEFMGLHSGASAKTLAGIEKVIAR
ncbi:3-deoxy-D-manno-octulosonic acid transferase [Shimia abyssi]|uniref:3-deoxy-D-manno-octulosonic acid transferase n=1 Tax=Shimia abyssi TaxID=1662395 RepID=A0A2P8FEK8_9RHOB|nr:glycosyltransferase N-terminal domain-containing protein [Shimia abyssi]PSL20157.1 3-deoxy-D-manno-octulosonic-acid transferase [Shimia abyssi]